MLIAEGDSVDVLTANTISTSWDMCLEQVRAIGRHYVQYNTDILGSMLVVGYKRELTIVFLFIDNAPGGVGGWVGGGQRCFVPSP